MAYDTTSARIQVWAICNSCLGPGSVPADFDLYPQLLPNQRYRQHWWNHTHQAEVLAPPQSSCQPVFSRPATSCSKPWGCVTIASMTIVNSLSKQDSHIFLNFIFPPPPLSSLSSLIPSTTWKSHSIVCLCGWFFLYCSFVEQLIISVWFRRQAMSWHGVWAPS